MPLGLLHLMNVTSLSSSQNLFPPPHFTLPMLVFTIMVMAIISLFNEMILTAFSPYLFVSILKLKFVAK